MATKTQKELIREYLERGNFLTPMDALELFRCFRLATRIFELKREGLDIVTDMVENKVTGKRYASYRLVPPMVCDDPVPAVSLPPCPHYRNRYFDRLHGLNYSQSYKGRTAAAWLEYWRGRAERVSNWLREFRPRRRGAKCK